uniref:Uncharacterized protein n=1 Tax=Rhinolophus ferrumequinum TaxID=59479 RepID=A0A671F325_RHIFE
MTHIAIKRYLREDYEAINNRNPASRAELVSFKHPRVANCGDRAPESSFQALVLEPHYDDMFAAHLRCTSVVGNHDFIEAYKWSVVVQSFWQAIQAHKENWALPAVCAVALDLRVFVNNPGSWRNLKSRNS